MATHLHPQAPWGEYVPRVGRMTVEQYAQFPSEDGWIYELHQGRLISMPGPGFDHAVIQTALYRKIDTFLQTNNLGILIGTGCYNLPLYCITWEHASRIGFQKRHLFAGWCAAHLGCLADNKDY